VAAVHQRRHRHLGPDRDGILSLHEALRRIRADAARRSRRGGDRVASALVARGVGASGRRGHLHHVAARSQVDPQDRTDRPRGDERVGRAGVPDADPAARRTVEDHRPLGAVRRDALSTPGPPRARDVARPHAGGGRGRDRSPGSPVVPGPAREPVPGRVEVPGRVPPSLRPAARPRVPDEGRIHGRPGRGGDGGVVRRHAVRVPEGVRPVRALVHRGRGRAGTDRRWCEPRVHGARGRRRGPVRGVRERRLPRRLEGRDPAPARTGVRRRFGAAREGPRSTRSRSCSPCRPNER
jgi:hypothetical protein